MVSGRRCASSVRHACRIREREHGDVYAACSSASVILQVHHATGCGLGSANKRRNFKEMISGCAETTDPNQKEHNSL